MIADLKPYPEYQPSGSPWLGDVPAHWQVRKLRTLIRPRNERNRPDLPLLSVARERGVFVRSMTDPDENHNVIPEDLSNYKVARAGSLVINKMKAWQGSMGIAPVDGIVSPAYYVYDFAIEHHAFGQALLRSKPYVAHFAAASDGVRVGQWDLSIAGMREIPVLVPPPEEQATIVRFLDWANGRLEQAIRAKRKVIALLNEQRQAIVHRAVTRGIDAAAPVKESGVDGVGVIPTHWHLRRMKQVCARIVDCKNRTPDQVDGGEFVVVRTTNVRNGRFNLTGSFSTDSRNYQIWTQRGSPNVGDVFFTREAPVGEACLVPDHGKLCMGQRMMYFRPEPSLLDSEFLLHSIYGPVVRHYIQVAVNGSTVGHLRLGQVSAIPLLWCPLEEQRQIVAYIRSATGPLQIGIEKLEAEMELLQEYRTRMCADIITGRVDVSSVAQSLVPLSAEIGPDEAPDTNDFEDELIS